MLNGNLSDAEKLSDPSDQLWSDKGARRLRVRRCLCKQLAALNCKQTSQAVPRERSEGVRATYTN